MMRSFLILFRVLLAREPRKDGTTDTPRSPLAHPKHAPSHRRIGRVLRKIASKMKAADNPKPPKECAASLVMCLIASFVRSREGLYCLPCQILISEEILYMHHISGCRMYAHLILNPPVRTSNKPLGSTCCLTANAFCFVSGLSLDQ